MTVDPTTNVSLDMNERSDLPVQIYLGGSFDPIHNSHIAILTHVYNTVLNTYKNNPSNLKPNLNLTAHFLPTSRSPLKTQSSNPQHRFNLLNLACKPLATMYPDISNSLDSVNHSVNHSFNDTGKVSPANSPFQINEHEIWQKPPTYSIDTFKSLREQHPRCSIIFIIGADNVASLSKWREGNNLTHYVHLWVIPRDSLQSKEEIATLLPLELQLRLTNSINDLKQTPSGCIYIDSHVVPTLSSSYIRRSIQLGNLDNVKSALPASVYWYIIKNNLYVD